jgi:hypothetical protein
MRSLSRENFDGCFAFIRRQGGDVYQRFDLVVVYSGDYSPGIGVRD